MKTSAPVVAIIGRANVGKSSLFNAILSRREVIVANEPGTTRDRITLKASHKGKDFWLVDTAGAKKAEDEFEITIQEQITDATQNADLILLVLEADVPVVQKDRDLAKIALKSQKPVIVVVNKIDKNRTADLTSWRTLGVEKIYATSTSQNGGIEELLDEIAETIKPGKISANENKIRLTVVGRPNVGKSSIFNSLAAKQEALVSAQAGTTRDVNRLDVRYMQKTIELADTAGIRRSGKIERGVEQFSVLRTLSAIEQTDIAALVMDATELNVQLDKKIAGMVKDAGKGLILVVNKYDALQEPDRNQLIARLGAEFDFVPWAPVVFTSALIGQNVTKLFELTLEIYQNRHLRVSTPKLNKWLEQTVKAHPPAGLNNQTPKLRYMVQEDDIDMPSFKIFGSKVKFLHWSYRRYLEKQFRENWPLEGTALKFWYIEK